MSHKLQIKQVDLSKVTKDNSKTRFLVIDSDGTVYWSDNVGGTVTYTNTDPVPTTLGGITAGSTFTNASMDQMWTMLLYPYQVPAFTSFSISGPSVLEVGETLPDTLTFTWNSSNDPNVSPNSITITDITGGSTIILNGQPSDGIAVPYTYGSPVVRTSTGSYTWQIKGLNTNGASYINNKSKSWYWRVFWGTSSSTALPDETFVKALLNDPIKSSRVGTYTFAANDYKYLAIPNEYGVPTSITYNGLPFALADSADGYNDGDGSITYTTVSITNAYGETETYNVFRSKNPIVGVVSMTIS